MVTLSNPDTIPCPVLLVLSDQNATDQRQVKDTGVSLDFAEPGPIARSGRPGLIARSVTVPPEGHVVVRLLPRLRVTGVPGPGPRLFNLMLGYSFEGTMVPSADRIFSLPVEVATRATITPAGTSSNRVIDLGDLRDGGAATASVYLHSNGPHSMTITSDNGGRLINTDETVATSVGYGVLLEGVYSGLDQPITVFRNSPTPLSGDLVKMYFSSPPRNDLFAGTYRDVIEIEVSPY